MVHTLTTHLNMYVVNRVVPSGTGMRLCTHTHTHTQNTHTHVQNTHTHTYSTHRCTQICVLPQVPYKKKEKEESEREREEERENWRGDSVLVRPCRI